MDVNRESLVVVPETLEDVQELHKLAFLVACGRLRTRPPLKKDDGHGEVYILITLDRDAAEKITG
jgi:hypothetical protein